MSARLKELQEWAKEEPKPAKSNKLLYGSIIAVLVVVAGLYLYNRSKKQAAAAEAVKTAPSEPRTIGPMAGRVRPVDR